MADMTLAQLALRERAKTLVICTTGALALTATATGFTRPAGSFLADGLVAGLEITPAGFADNAIGTIQSVTALEVVLREARAAEAGVGGRSLAAGLPVTRKWENVEFDPPVGRVYIEESFTEGTSTVRSLPADGGVLDDTGLYVLRWYGLANTGMRSLRDPMKKLRTLFKPGTTLPLSDGTTLRIRTDVSPTVSGIQPGKPGWSMISIAIPWRLLSLNT
jgi:hypothetical protein